MKTDKIIFPPKFAPGKCPIFVHNEIEINSSAENIWSWLTYATSWHDWYFNASDLHILNVKNDYLVNNTKFKWKTFGVRLRSEIKEYIPYERLAWDAHGMGVHAYHAWLIIPEKTKCLVITEETQYGLTCILGKIIFPHRMHHYHQVWLEGLKKMAENRPPVAP